MAGCQGAAFMLAGSWNAGWIANKHDYLYVGVDAHMA